MRQVCCHPMSVNHVIDRIEIQGSMKTRNDPYFFENLLGYLSYKMTITIVPKRFLGNFLFLTNESEYDETWPITKIHTFSLD